jgi:integrase
VETEFDQKKEWWTKKEVVDFLKINPSSLALMLRRANLGAKGKGKARRYHRDVVATLHNKFTRGLGVATTNAYLVAVKGFTRWLVRDRRTGMDPLAHLSRLNAQADIRWQRRVLEEEELQWLLESTQKSPVTFRGLTGEDRYFLYATAMGTGLRASELASLFPQDFALDENPAMVRLQGAYTKNRKEAQQPLSTELTQLLRGYLAGRSEDQLVWGGTWKDEAADLLRIDLQAAGIAFEDPDGKVLDFHSFRHFFVTSIVKGGASPKVAQTLARHSDVRLTLGVYSHAGLYDLAGAVESLPSLLPAAPSKEPSVMAATGTDDSIPAAPFERRHQTDDAAIENMIVDENTGPDSGHDGHVLQLPGLTRDKAACENMIPDDSNGPSRIRTCNQGIMSPLLCR